MKKEHFVNVEILNIVNEKREDDRTVEDLKIDYPNEKEKLEEALIVYIGENNCNFKKTQFPDNKWKYLTRKLAYPYE